MRLNPPSCHCNTDFSLRYHISTFSYSDYACDVYHVVVRVKELNYDTFNRD